jgi:hypothetical protein
MIREGLTADHASEYRRHLHNGDRLSARLARRRIPTFSPGGLFQGLWGPMGLLSYSQLVLLETECLHPNLIPYYRSIIQEDPLTHACFHSLAGDSLRILVNTTGSPDVHFKAFSELKRYFELLLHLRCSSIGDDLLTLCHIPFDPSAFLNPDSEVFITVSSHPGPPPIPADHHLPLPTASHHTTGLQLLPANA